MSAACSCSEKPSASRPGGARKARPRERLALFQARVVTFMPIWGRRNACLDRVDHDPQHVGYTLPERAFMGQPCPKVGIPDAVDGGDRQRRISEYERIHEPVLTFP